MGQLRLLGWGGSARSRGMAPAPVSTIRRGARPFGPTGSQRPVFLWLRGVCVGGGCWSVGGLGVSLLGIAAVLAGWAVWVDGVEAQQPSFGQQWNAAQQARLGAPSPSLMPPAFGQTQPALGTPPGQIGPPPQLPPGATGFGAPVNPYSQYAPPTFPPPTLSPGGVPGTGNVPPGVYFSPPPGAAPTAGVVPSNVAVSGFDPFAAPAIGPGYPNLPDPQSSMFQNPFVTPATNSAALFADPQSSGYGAGGQLNNPYSNSSQTWSAQSWQRFWQQSDWQKLWHAFRMRHTYIQGGSINRVQINDTEIATSLSFPNFFGSQMPVTISPGFIFHNWQGPNSITGNDLPGSAYSAYLSFDHSTPLDQQLGGEFNFTTGVYSDFNTFTKHSLRFTGVGLLWYRLSPTSTLKFGVEYLDRVEIKLLPAGGLFWTPDPNTRLSFYFPRPKFAKRFPNFGNTEVWGYVSGEYGGGSWTVQREAGFSDQVDLNDMRVTAGLEWIGVRGITGFGEFGYVFERQLIYRSTSPADDYLGSAILFRGGFAY